MSQEINASPPLSLPVRDFPDWVSPIVVKELRQGLRSRMFSVCLIGLHIAMLLVFSMNMLAQQEGSQVNTEAMDTFFWIIALVPILLLIPASGNGLIQGEVKSGTMELVKMTSLNWWNIVVGKWSAMVVQTLLLVVSTLPYVVFRYFLGGVGLLDEMYLLYGATLISLALSALGLLSSTLGVVWRILGLLMIVPGLFSIVGGFMVGRRFSGGSMEITHPFSFYLAMTVVVAGFIYYFLLMTSTFLTKGQETWSGRKRLLGAAALVIGLGLQLFFNDTMGRHEWLRMVQVSLLPLISMIAAEGMFHRLRAWPKDRWSYQRASRWGKLKTAMSVSGWPVHLIYLILLSCVTLLCITCIKGGELSSESLRTTVGIFPAILAGMVAHVVYAAILRWQGNLFSFAVVLNVVSVVLLIFAGVFSMIDQDDAPIYTILGILYPPLGFPALMEHLSTTKEFVHPLEWAYGVWILVALRLGLTQWRKWWKWVRHAP